MNIRYQLFFLLEIFCQGPELTRLILIQNGIKSFLKPYMCFLRIILLLKKALFRGALK
jgi:hypothetical protein